MVNRFALVVAALLAVFAIFWAAGAYLARPAMSRLGSVPEGAVAVSFDSASGSTLHGWLFPVEEPRGSVALMHELRGNRTSMMARARLMNELRFSALVFDFQAHGESEGDHITFGGRESYDAQAAVRYLDERAGDRPIYVVGVSLGGAAALLSNPPLAVDGIVLEAVFPDISTAIANRLSMRVPFGSLLTPMFTAQLRLGLGMPAERLSPVRSAMAVKVPVLVLAGSHDRHTTLQDTQRLYDALPGRKRLVVFEGAAHVDLLDYEPQRYAVEIERFLSSLVTAVPGDPGHRLHWNDETPGSTQEGEEFRWLTS